MVLVKVMEVGEKVIGIDTDGVVVEVYGFISGNLHVGDLVQGNLLNESDDDADFYLDAVRVVQPNPAIQFDETFYQEHYKKN